MYFQGKVGRCFENFTVVGVSTSKYASFVMTCVLSSRQRQFLTRQYGHGFHCMFSEDETDLLCYSQRSVSRPAYTTGNFSIQQSACNGQIDYIPPSHPACHYSVSHGYQLVSNSNKKWFQCPKSASLITISLDQYDH